MTSSVPTPYQNAIRLLFILVHGAERLVEEKHSDAAGLFKGETRLHAMDFWVRYPDYLAYELINIFEKTRDIALLTKAEEIFEDEEPDIRRIPMIRWRFGAYEKIDNTLSVLISKGLVRQEGKKNSTAVQEYHYLIMPRAYLLAESIAQDFPSLGWYEQRAKLVAEVAGNRGGTALKDQQYEHITYANTSLGSIIQPITNVVKTRIEALKSQYNF
jgi:hypothetical protein